MDECTIQYNKNCPNKKPNQINQYEKLIIIFHTMQIKVQIIIIYNL